MKTKTRKVTEYFEICHRCGREFRTTKAGGTICPKCREDLAEQAEQEAEQKEKDKISFMIGARIIAIEISGHGVFASSNEITSIVLETINSKKITLTAAEWGERYIEWEEA